MNARGESLLRFLYLLQSFGGAAAQVAPPPTLRQAECRDGRSGCRAHRSEGFDDSFLDMEMCFLL